MPPKEPKPVDKKRSIKAYETLCASLIQEADDFASTNTAGLTTNGKEEAKDHIKSLKDQLSRMKNRWEDEF